MRDDVIDEVAVAGGFGMIHFLACQHIVYGGKLLYDWQASAKPLQIRPFLSLRRTETVAAVAALPFLASQRHDSASPVLVFRLQNRSLAAAVHNRR